MLSAIQLKAVRHFRQAIHAPITSKNLSEWFDFDYNGCLNMMTLDHEITVFVCLVDGYFKVVEDLAISLDLLEPYRKGFQAALKYCSITTSSRSPRTNGPQLHFVILHE